MIMKLFSLKIIFLFNLLNLPQFTLSASNSPTSILTSLTFTPIIQPRSTI